MPAAKSPTSAGSGGEGSPSGPGSQTSEPHRAHSAAEAKPRRAAPKQHGSGRTKKISAGNDRNPGGRGVADGLANFAEDMTNRIIKPLDLVLLTRERIQATLDEAAERGRVTRTDANDLVSELVKRGRQQTDDLLADLEGRLGRSREQLESAGKRVESAGKRVRRTPPVDRLVRGADRARRTVAPGAAFPISNYDDLTVAQVAGQLTGLTPAHLRKIREYERSHANRKSVLAAVETLLG